MCNSIETTIENWFQETNTKMEEEIKISSPLNTLCLTILPISYTYCRAVLALTNGEYRLPPIGLLRVLGELSIRLAWCIYEHEGRNETADVKVRRWAKRSYMERKKQLLDQMTCTDTKVNAFPPKDECRKEIEDLDHLIKEISYDPAPSVWGCLKDLPTMYKNDMYPVIYSAYHRGVHPDMLVFGNMLRLTPNGLSIQNDLYHIPTPHLKVFCLTAAYNIVVPVRKNYNWDYQNIKTEYLAIKESLKADE